MIVDESKYRTFLEVILWLIILGLIIYTVYDYFANTLSWWGNK